MAFFARQRMHGMAPRQRGGAAIEMILIFPILLLLLYTAVSYAILFWAYQGLNGMTSELAGQIIRQEWYEEDSGSHTLDIDEINLALAALRDNATGPAATAGWCSGSPSISSDGDIDRLSVCLVAEESLLPQISLLGVKLPHETSVSVTATLRVPQ
ncbi:TadE/TadG family type IV pilus assembly protein [Halomonas sp. Y3]|uniref:TadE/TadG family type IV pilus assembly protein n=1 Tax=Halomonas sp. Y3 TaxID=2956797 RepID=UPI00209DF7D5|nr:TadE/TadG family type IV pilus assembly protein [Halomonas sp. Y3]